MKPWLRRMALRRMQVCRCFELKMARFRTKWLEFLTFFRLILVRLLLRLRALLFGETWHECLKIGLRVDLGHWLWVWRGGIWLIFSDQNRNKQKKNLLAADETREFGGVAVAEAVCCGLRVEKPPRRSELPQAEEGFAGVGWTGAPKSKSNRLAALLFWLPSVDPLFLTVSGALSVPNPSKSSMAGAGDARFGAETLSPKFKES